MSFRALIAAALLLASFLLVVPTASAIPPPCTGHEDPNQCLGDPWAGCILNGGTLDPRTLGCCPSGWTCHDQAAAPR